MFSVVEFVVLYIVLNIVPMLLSIFLKVSVLNVLVLFSMLFQYYTKIFVSVSVLNDSQIVCSQKLSQFFFTFVEFVLNISQFLKMCSQFYSVNVS